MKLSQMDRLMEGTAYRRMTRFLTRGRRYINPRTGRAFTARDTGERDQEYEEVSGKIR